MAQDLNLRHCVSERGMVSVAIVSAHFMGDILGAENYCHSD
jgi:hypothetical protein